MKLLWLCTRAQLHWSWVLLPLWLGAMLAVTFYLHRQAAGRQVRDLYVIFEYYLPLAAAVYLGGVPSFDREEGAAETHLSYPQHPVFRLGLLALPRVAAWAATAAAGLLVVQIWYLDGQTAHLLKVMAPPALALTGAAMAGAAAARMQLGGIMAAFFWWALDATSLGYFNKQFFLFRASIWTGMIAPEVQTRNILLMGTVCLALALWGSHRRSWWIR